MIEPIHIATAVFLAVAVTLACKSLTSVGAESKTKKAKQ